MVRQFGSDGLSDFSGVFAGCERYHSFVNIKGTQLLHHDRFDAIAERLGWPTQDPSTIHRMHSEKGLRRIHPAFRLVALAAPASTKSPWLTAEVLEMFAFHEMPRLAPSQLLAVRLRNCTSLNSVVDRYAVRHRLLCCNCDCLLQIAEHSLQIEAGHSLDLSSANQSKAELRRLLESLERHSSDVSPAGATHSQSQPDASHIELNVRQLKRILRQQQHTGLAQSSEEGLFASVSRAVLGDFLPPPLRSAFADILETAGINRNTGSQGQSLEPKVKRDPVEILDDGTRVRIGKEISQIYTPTNPELVIDYARFLLEATYFESNRVSLCTLSSCLCVGGRFPKPVSTIYRLILISWRQCCEIGQGASATLC